MKDITTLLDVITWAASIGSWILGTVAIILYLRLRQQSHHK